MNGFVRSVQCRTGTYLQGIVIFLMLGTGNQWGHYRLSSSITESKAHYCLSWETGVPSPVAVDEAFVADNNVEFFSACAAAVDF